MSKNINSSSLGVDAATHKYGRNAYMLFDLDTWYLWNGNSWRRTEFDDYWFHRESKNGMLIPIEEDFSNPTAADLMQKGLTILEKRSNEYSTTEGEEERSFEAIVTAFNAITGKDLTPAEGALFMQILKDVRQWAQDRLHEDSVTDSINYAALKGAELYKQYGD